MKALIMFLIFTTSAWASEWKDIKIPYPYMDVQNDEENKLMLINRGESALQSRIDLIRRAQSTIEVEYFIFKTDISGKIIARELVEASKRGVKVRMLVDKIGAGSYLSRYHAKELRQHGIDIKYYNTSSILNLGKINFRDHRKLIIVDDAEVITGGRNIGNDYFNLDEVYNYEDRDMLIEGPIVKTIRESFDAYFEDKLSHRISLPSKPVVSPINQKGGGIDPAKQYERRTKDAKIFLTETEEEIQVRQEIAEITAEQMKNVNYHSCPQMTYVTDTPSGDFLKSRQEGYLENFRHVMKTLDSKMSSVDKELTISTPYFIANKRNQKLLNDLLQNKVSVNLYTNSLKAADAIYMATGFYSYLKSWLGRGMKVFLHDGKWTEMGIRIKRAPKSRWGTHAKTQVYEWQDGDSEVMIGTYNMDNRSDYYNNELVIFCKGNADLTAELKDDIMKLAGKGMTVGSNDFAIDRKGDRINILGTSGINKLKLLFATIPTWLFEHLL